MRRIPLPALCPAALALACAAGLPGAAPAAAELVSPEAFLGHPVGADRTLAPYGRVLDYLRLAAAGSDRVSYEVAGESTRGEEMAVVVLTSPRNQARLERVREISRRLADPEGLAPAEVDALAAEGAVVALVTCTIHSTEVGCTQMVMELVWQFATTRDPERLAWMEDVVLLVVPSINPDGQVMIIDWYDRYKGTEFEGGRMPWLYHPYVGHDNNRDFYMLTQKETRVLNDILYHRWFPQVFVDEHQMGSVGPRMFVPPQTDPLAPEIDSLIFRQADLIGTNMSYRLEEAGKTGVGHNMIFDSYWPGGTRNTAWWKNVTGLLTEVASARIATPIYIEPGELRGGYKGLPEYKRRANFPSPWPGGWWRLRDIVDYELVATWATVETCSQYRGEFLRNFATMAGRATEAGRSGPPYAWLIPPGQHDPVAAERLVELLLRHGVRVETADEPLAVGLATYPPGTALVRAAQPYRSFLLTMLRRQRYPEIRPHVDGPILTPYDVTAWSLPLLMGVELHEAEVPPSGATSPRAEPRWPGGAVPESDNGWLVSHAHDTVFAAMNRLLERGRRLFWLVEGEGGAAAGDVYVPAGEATAAELGEISADLHLEIRPAGAMPIAPRLEVSPTRVGLYQPWRASMDEGWTRWLLERYEFPYTTLHNEDLRDGDFRDAIDVLLLPDVDRSTLVTGEPDVPPDRRRRLGELPPEYAGGIEEDGGRRIRDWVESGGVLVALDSSSEYAIELFELPVANALSENGPEDFYAPGTLLRVEVDTSHPLAYGMRPREAVYFAGSPAFRTSVPDARFERRVVARYPDHRDDLLVSGWIRGAERLERLAAAVEYRVGDGRVVLIGFRAQHRAQPHRTFKMLFNALYLGGLREVAP